MKKLIMIMMGIFLLASVSAQTIFFQQTNLYTNSTLSHAYVFYDADFDNFITGGNQLEVYALYTIYVDSWNELNPDYPVSACNFSVMQYAGNSSTPSMVYSDLIFDDYRNAKYFVRMSDNDFVTFDIECFWQSTNTSQYIPANFQVVTPTTECQECQYYEWTLVERDIIKAEEVGSNSVDVVNYMYQVVYLNFEIWLALFWIILIIIAIHSTGFIFIGLIWMFGYLKNLVT